MLIFFLSQQTFLKCIRIASNKKITRIYNSDYTISKNTQFEKDIHLFFQYSISENLHKNQSAEVLFWKDWAFPFTEAVAQRCSVKKLFLEFREILRKTPAPESLF